MSKEHASLGEQSHTSASANKELCANFLLERADLPANGGLRDVETLRCAPNMAFLGDSDKVSNLRETHVTKHTSRFSPYQGGATHETKTVLDCCHNNAPQMRVMPIDILGPRQIEGMRSAGRTAAETLAFVGSQLRIGMPTGEIDRLVREDTARRGGRPSQLGYKGFPAAVCTSRNHVVCHGIPNARELLAPGDIINVDVTTNVNGYHGDTSATFIIGEASQDAMRIVNVARRCRDAGIGVIRDGARLGDIGAAIEEVARKEGVGVVTELGGHGIGRHMHAEPHVPHTARRGTGRRTEDGDGIHRRANDQSWRFRSSVAQRWMDRGYRGRKPIRSMGAHCHRDT